MTGFRDMSVPYTEAELEELRDLFRSFKSFKDGCLSVTDFPDLIRGMRYERTPDQVQAYMKYYEEKREGKVSLEDFIKSAMTLHKSVLFAKDLARKYDNGSGTIGANEFARILELMQEHDPAMKAVTFEDFVKAAGVSQAGQVSISECEAWIEKNSSK